MSNTINTPGEGSPGFPPDSAYFIPGTPESYIAIKEEESRDSFARHNARASLAQIKKEKEMAAAGPGLGGAPTDRFSASTHARWYASIGLKPGEVHSSEDEVILALARQRQRTKMLVAELKPAVTQLYAGNGLDPSDRGMGDDLLKADPEIWIDELQRRGYFRNEADKDLFRRHIGMIDSQMGVSPFVELRNHIAGLSPVYREGRVIYEKMNARNGYRIPRNDDGIRQLEALTKYRQYLSDTGQDGIDGWSIPEMFGKAIVDVASGIVNIAAPDDDISPEWRADPEKYARVRGVLDEFRNISARYGENPLVEQGTEEEMTAARRVQSSQGMLRSLDKKDIIVTNPSHAGQLFVGQNLNVSKELVELYNQGAFVQNGRLAPLASALDGLVLSVAGLTSLFYHSEDPNSVVNFVRQIDDNLTISDESIHRHIEAKKARLPAGSTVTREQAIEDIRKLALIETINQAMAYREGEQDAMNYGFAFRTNGGAKGKTYIGDLIGLTGDNDMLRGAQLLADPFVAAGFAFKAMKAAKNAKTATQLTRRLQQATVALEKMQRIGMTNVVIPDALKPLAENIRANMARAANVAPETIKDMDVLVSIERGEARIADIAADGTQTLRKLTKSELALFSDEVVKSAERVEQYHAKRLAVSRRIVERNSGKPLSTWGKWVGADYLAELTASFDNPIVKKLTDVFTKVGLMGSIGQRAAADVSRGALNRSAIFGAAKTADIWRRVAGVTLAGGGALAASPFSLAAGVVGAALLIPDVLSAVGWSGNAAKYLTNYMRYYGSNRQIGGSIAAARLRDISHEIERLKAFRSGGASLTEAEIKQWRLGELPAGRLSGEQLRKIDSTIELLEGEAAWVQNMHSLGLEGAIIGTMKTTGGVVSSTLLLDTLMKANDSNSRTDVAAMFAASGHVLNAGFGTFFRQTSNARRRVDINSIEFNNLIQRSDPTQAQRLIQAYVGHKATGTHQNFVAAIVHMNRLLNPNTSVIYTDRAGMAANSVLLQASHLVDSTGQQALRSKLESDGRAKGLQGKDLQDYIKKGLKDEVEATDSYNLRKQLVAEATSRGLKGDEANAYVQTELEKRLATRATAERKQKVESDYAILSAEQRLLAEKLEQAHVEELAALEVLQQAYKDMGIPMKRKDGKPVEIKPADLSSPAAFIDAIKRELGDNVIGGVVDGKPTGLMALPPDQFKDLFEKLKIAQVGHLNSQKGRLRLTSEFNSVHSRWTAVAQERIANIDTDASLDSRNWRRGSTFAYTDYGMGSGPGLGYVVADGVFVVDRTMPDGTIKSDIVLNLEDLKIGPIYEELAHAIFVSSSFRGFRNIIEKNLYGDWVYNAQSGSWISKQDPDAEPKTGWLSRNTDVEGVLVQFDNNGNPKLPALRLFADAYSDNLTPEAKAQFMARFERAEQLFSQNPELGIRLMQDVTNELFAFGYRQRLMNAAPGSFKNSTDPTGTDWARFFEGSALMPNAGDAGPGSNSGASSAIKVLFAKMLVGDVTMNEAMQMYTKIAKGDFGPMSPAEMQFLGTESFAKILAVFGRRGIADRIVAKTLSKGLLEAGLSPEIFGVGNWTSNKLFHEKTGEALDLPPGLRDIIDTAHYFVRDRISETDPYMFEDYSVWDSKTGQPFDVWPKGHPLAGQQVNHVLYAASRNQMNLIDGRTGKLRNLHEIISEERKSMEQFTRLLLHANAAGEVTSFQVTGGAVYLNGAGRMTKEESARIIKAARDSNMSPNQFNVLVKIVSDLADSNADNPITPERAGRLPIYNLLYRGVERETIAGRTRRVGGQLSERNAVIYNVFTDYTGYDSNGRPIIDDRGNQQFIRATFANVFDLDALGRRFELFWNGQLKDENNVVPPLMKYNSVRARFKNKAEIQEVVDQYLVHLAEGGRIARDLKDTKFPSKTAVDTFRDFLIAQGKYPNPEEAQYLAQVAHHIVGSRASEYVLTGKMPSEGVGDMDIGSRKIRQRGSIENPPQAADDMNFPITTIRLDRVVSLSDLKGYGSWGGQFTFPWTQFSSGWLNAAYSPSSGWNTIIPPKGSSYGIFLQKELQNNSQLQSLVSNGIKALYSHPLGYKIVNIHDGRYQIYDADHKYVKETQSYGEAISIATSHARMRPLRSNSQFDALMTQMGFNPVGLETVSVRGLRRANFLTPDKQFTIKFNQRGIASIIDNNSNAPIAKNIHLEVMPDGKFDFSELQAALQLTYDNITLGANKLDLSLIPGEEGTPMSRFLNISGFEHKGIKKPVQKRMQKLAELRAKYGDDFVEFTPVIVGRQVAGQRLFSFANQSYYNIKGKLVDMYGHKGAVDVLNAMKKELGDDVVANNEKAVVEWFDRHLQTKESERLAAERQAELDRRAKEWQAATKEVDRRTSMMRSAFIDPVNRAILGIQQSRQTSNMPPVTDISPSAARAELASQLAIMRQKLANQPEADAVALSGMRGAMDRLGKATETMSRDLSDSTAIMWKNSAGHIIMMDLLDQPPAIHGLDVGVNLSWLTQRAGQGKFKVRFRVYNPNGAFMGVYNSKEEMAEAFLEGAEKTANEKLGPHGQEQRFKRDLMNR